MSQKTYGLCSPLLFWIVPPSKRLRLRLRQSYMYIVYTPNFTYTINWCTPEEEADQFHWCCCCQGKCSDWRRKLGLVPSPKPTGIPTSQIPQIMASCRLCWNRNCYINDVFWWWVSGEEIASFNVGAIAISKGRSSAGAPGAPPPQF